MDKSIKFATFEMELKEVKEVAGEGHIEGYASTFGNLDLGFDIVEKGAFKKTIKDSGGKWPVLADHNPSEQIGWNTDAKEDDVGLFTKSVIMLDVAKGREKMALAKKAMEIKARAGFSIGYSTIKASPDDKNPRIRHLQELKMWEHSLVTFPMNVEALVTAAKGIGAIDKARFLIESLKAQGISMQDLELALRQEAAATDEDPTKISQSFDRLIEKFRNN